MAGIGVEDGQPALEAVGAVGSQAFELGKKRRAVFAQQQQLGALGGGSGQHAGQKMPKRQPMGRGHALGKAPPGQPLAHTAQQPAGTGIELGNEASGSERKKAHRDQVVQVEVLRAGVLGLGLGQQQRFVLHFYLQLVHLQLLHQALGFLGSQGRQGRWQRGALLLGAGAQGQQFGVGAGTGRDAVGRQVGTKHG